MVSLSLSLVALGNDTNTIIEKQLSAGGRWKIRN